MNSNDRLSQGDLEDLLPWHAAGTLDANEAAEVERALAADPELARRFALVREELTETILLNESLGALWGAGTVQLTASGGSTFRYGAAGRTLVPHEHRSGHGLGGCGSR